MLLYLNHVFRRFTFKPMPYVGLPNYQINSIFRNLIEHLLNKTLGNEKQLNVIEFMAIIPEISNFAAKQLASAN